MDGIDWARLPPLTTLRAFEATARLQGYSAASRALNVTPAAIAQQVRKLEVEIGTSLVRREGRGLALTEAGQSLAVPLQEAFSMIAKGIQNVQIEEARRGVRVSTTDYFASAVILPRLGEYWKSNPMQQVSLSPDGNTAPVDLEAFDIVVRGGAPDQQWPECRATRLLETPMVLIAAPDLIAKRGNDPSVLPWLSDHSIGGGVIQEAIKRAGCDPEAVEFVDPGDAKLELDAVLMGYGVSFSPEMTVRGHLANGSLVKLDVDIGMRGVYYALTRKGPIPEQAQKFLDWLVAISGPLSI